MSTKGKAPTQIILVTGNADDGWNVEAHLDEHKVTFACEDQADANDLQDLLNRCAWFDVVKE